MEGSIGQMLLLQLALIALNAIFACAEIAVISMNETKLDKLANEGNKRAKRLKLLTAQPARFLATIQVAITLSGFLGSAFAAENFSDVLVQGLLSLGVPIPERTLDTIAVVVITLILSYITLIFGELVPKRIAMNKTEQIALGISGLVYGISKLFAPLVWLLSASTNGVLRLCGIDPTEEEEAVSEEEIRMMVDAGGQKGAIDQKEQEFIQNVFEFDDLTAGEISTHRTEIDLLWMDDPIETWTKTIHQARHTRYPVCGDSADQVVGVLNAKDFFRLLDQGRDVILEKAIKPAYFVPENVKADVLFQNMRRGHKSLAVVLDEYGGMVGIVTISDLLEQLVGALEDDEPDDGTDPQIFQIGENSFGVRGNIELDELERTAGAPFADRGESDTLTGLVFNTMEMILGDGVQDVTLRCDPYDIHVRSVRHHQITDAVITLRPEAPSAEKDKEKDEEKEEKHASSGKA